MASVKLKSSLTTEARRFRIAKAAAGVSYAAIARHMGVGRKYVSAAAKSDTSGKAVSPEQWRRLWDAFTGCMRAIGE